MFLQNLIKKELALFTIDVLAKKLGYSSSKKIQARITAILASPTLNLDQSHYDFHYSTPELIRKLCDILSIPIELCNAILNETELKLRKERSRFKPYIFIETNFKRKNEPIFALAALQGRRYLYIDNNLNIPLNVQLDYIQELIRDHYFEQTEIPPWGDINQYAYFYDEKTVVVFATSGEIIAVTSEYFVSTATMSL